MVLSDILNSIISSINEPLWNYVLVFMLMIIGIYFTLGTRFVQFRYLFSGFQYLTHDPLSIGQKGITDYQAFSISAASRIGVGNITGIATAIAIGGPGSVFWMWLFAFFGMVIAFVECVLAQLYKQPNGDNFIGGPAYYIEKALGMRWLGVVFAVVIIITYGFIFNMLQANTIAVSMDSFYHLNPHYIGIALGLFTASIIFGGIKRVALFCSIIVPIMLILYLSVTLIIIMLNIHQVFHFLMLVFSHAFSSYSLMGGTLGTVIMQGVRRGLFTNEGGMGSTPNAAALSHTTHPVKQGLTQSFSVFLETVIICGCTAFIIIISGIYDHGLQGTDLVRSAMSSKLGIYTDTFLTLSILSFAMSTIIGNYFFGENNILYLNGSKKVIFIYRIFVSLLVVFGATMSLKLIWTLSDFFMAIMAFINLYAIVVLFPRVQVVLDDFDKQRQDGLDPVFHKNIMKEFESDIW